MSNTTKARLGAFEIVVHGPVSERLDVFNKNDAVFSPEDVGGDFNRATYEFAKAYRPDNAEVRTAYQNLVKAVNLADSIAKRTKIFQALNPHQTKVWLNWQVLESGKRFFDR